MIELKLQKEELPLFIGRDPYFSVVTEIYLLLWEASLQLMHRLDDETKIFSHNIIY